MTIPVCVCWPNETHAIRRGDLKLTMKIYIDVAKLPLVSAVAGLP